MPTSREKLHRSSLPSPLRWHQYALDFSISLSGTRKKTSQGPWAKKLQLLRCAASSSSSSLFRNFERQYIAAESSEPRLPLASSRPGCLLLSERAPADNRFDQHCTKRAPSCGYFFFFFLPPGMDDQFFRVFLPKIFLALYELSKRHRYRISPDRCREKKKKTMDLNETPELFALLAVIRCVFVVKSSMITITTHSPVESWPLR